MLALSMAVSTFMLPVSASTTNLALNKSASASDYEVATTSPDKAVDGNHSTRWGTSQNKLQNEWIEIDLGSVQTVRQIKVFFERETAAQNITSFKVELYNDGAYTNVYQKDTRASKEENIVLDQNYSASKVKLTILAGDGGTMGWVNVGINEIEVYDENQENVLTAKNLAATIEGGILDLDVDDLTLDLPEGYSAKIIASDYEELINKDGEVRHPLEDKEVKLVWEVSNTDGSDVAKTAELTYTLLSRTIQGTNAKPQIIPEISEWLGGDGTLEYEDVETISWYDTSLDAIGDEFIQDYETMTGRSISRVPSGGDIQLRLNTSEDDMLGEEGYLMMIDENNIGITGIEPAGVMFGLQSVLQMSQIYVEGYPVGRMRDYPRFKVRGLLLDVARKPISMDMIKMIGRTMRYYKMNDYQIHLSDNYIFLENYGKGATENEAFKAYDAFRLESSLKNDKGESPTATDYYFTKDDFREFIQSERALGMNIVPEIDLPAHANSFTKVWPELMLTNMTSPLNTNRPLIDHFDVGKPETVAKIKEIFDDYTKGSNPTFDSETTVHAGADEFVANYGAYRSYFNEIVPYVKQTNPVRIWGGLTWIDDGVTEIIPEAIENVEMNLWSKDWACGQQMYDMGFKLINTIDDYTYMVPNGNGSRANAYGDYLNVERVFDSFAPNKVRTQNGSYVEMPAGDDQILGAVYAIWSDNIDKHSSGLDESDYFHRFYDALPFFAEKTWATTGKEKDSAANLVAVQQNVGFGPVNPYYDIKEEVNYDFANDYVLGTADVKDEAVVLDASNDYLETGVDRAGWGNMLSFDVTLTQANQEGKILFESDAAYGTHDIRIMDNGKLGFTRELHDYYFDYTLPVNQKVNVAIVSSQEKTDLYINEGLVATAVGSFTHNGMLKKENINNASFAIATQRIGSKTNAASAIIDNVVISDAESMINPFKKENWTGSADTETEFTDTEGLFEYAFDGKPGTIWHSDWKNGTDKLTGSNTFTGEIDLGAAYPIKGFIMTPRQDGNLSGVVTKADLYVKETADGEWVQVASDATFAATADAKTITFDSQNVRYVKFVAKQSNDGWVAVSEFDFIKGNTNEQPPVVDTTPPEGPASAYISDTTATSITMKWEASVSDDVVKYVITNWDTNEILGETIDTTFVVENLTPNTKYFLSVYAVDAAGNESAATIVSDTTLPEPLDAVTNLRADDTNYKTITLVWEAVEGATAYDVYRKGYKEDASYELVDTVSETTYESVGVMTGKEYSFYVVAKNDVVSAEPSTIVSAATTLQGTVTLEMEQVSTSKFHLSWNKVDGATRYIVYRKRNDDKMKKVLTLGGDVLEYTTAEMPNGEYQFQVKAGRYDSTDRVMTGASNKVSGTVEALKPTVTATAGTKSAKISWKKMEGVTHYQVYRATSSSGKYTKLVTTKELSYTAKSLTKGKKYYFKVRGYKTYKSGTDIQYNVYTPYSSVKSVTAK